MGSDRGTKISTGGANYSTAATMFGGGLPNGIPESDGMATYAGIPGNPRLLATYFEDGQPLGFQHWIEWKTRNVVELKSVGLFARHDPPEDGYLYRRAFSKFVLYAQEGKRWVELVQYHPPLPYAQTSKQGISGTSLAVCLPVPPTHAQIFKAVFVQARNILNQYSGPRVVGLDGNDATCSEQYPKR
jgi:hypothetical protein